MVPAGFPPQGGGMFTPVPYQPLPLQSLEWFNARGGTPDGGWCFVQPPCQPPPPIALNQRKKRYSTDSQVTHFNNIQNAVYLVSLKILEQDCESKTLVCNRRHFGAVPVADVACLKKMLSSVNLNLTFNVTVCKNSSTKFPFFILKI